VCRLRRAAPAAHRTLGTWSNEKDPRQEPDAERDGERVEQAGSVHVVHPRPLEKQEPYCDRRVRRDVDHVDKRRVRDLLLAKDLMPEFVGRVASDEEEHAAGKEPPGSWSTRRQCRTP